MIKLSTCIVCGGAGIDRGSYGRFQSVADPCKICTGLGKVVEVHTSHVSILASVSTFVEAMNEKFTVDETWSAVEAIEKWLEDHR